ncbi:MAG TPA: tetratricopeptide repeat protein [Planctomycetota bacterium]|nr:tetratricopeptide repeat protein [Planctomycetota bacterium]
MRLGFDDPSVERRFWIERLRDGRQPFPVGLLDRIASPEGEVELAALLRSRDAGVRDRATAALWALWSRAGGEWGERKLQRATEAVDAGEPRRALDVLTRAIAARPGFAEAWNKRATVHFLVGDYERALRDCEETLRRNPIHFGALHGMGLCLLQLDKPREALAAFERAAAIQPHSEGNRRAIRACKRMLPSG